VPLEATKPAVFGLPDEKPLSWIQYDGPIKYDLFENLMRYCTRAFDADGRRDIILLKVDLKPEDDPHVVDYLHILNSEEEMESEPDAGKRRAIRAEGCRRYWESRIPFEYYQGDFALPEIIVWTPIPQERVHLVWQKDLYKLLEEAHNHGI
jgi:hypothetical protein